MRKGLVARGMFCSSFHCQQCLIQSKDSKEVPLCRRQAAEGMFFLFWSFFRGRVPSPLSPFPNPTSFCSLWPGWGRSWRWRGQGRRIHSYEFWWRWHLLPQFQLPLLVQSCPPGPWMWSSLPKQGRRQGLVVWAEVKVRLNLRVNDRSRRDRYSLIEDHSPFCSL